MNVLIGAVVVLVCLGLLWLCFAYVAHRINQLLGDLDRAGK